MVRSGHLSAGVPGAGLGLTKAAQIHRIADQFNPVKRRKDERDDDQQAIFNPIPKLGFARKFKPASLLGKADIVVVPLDIRKITQGECHGIGYFVGYTDPIQRGSKFTWVGGEKEDDTKGDHGGVFHHLSDAVEQLLLGERESTVELHDRVICSVDFHTHFRVEEEGDDRIGQDEDKYVDDHQADL